MRFLTLFVVTISLMTFTLSFGKTENPLEKSEALITELKFYDALIALEPLLMANEKSENQEKALWIANKLSKQLSYILSDEIWDTQKQKDPDLREVAYSKVMNKIKTINNYGARLTYFGMGGGYLYYYGFLKRLVELYPNSSWHSAAEYYLIQEGSPVPQDEQKILKALYAYVKKYEKTGLAELYMAYLDIARINHGLWAFLAHPEDDPFGNATEYSSGDPKKDKELAAVHKAEALKYYAKYIVSGYMGSYPGWGEERTEVLKNYEEIKQDKPTGYSFLVID